jgi:hypothetical protein
LNSYCGCLLEGNPAVVVDVGSLIEVEIDKLHFSGPSFDVVSDAAHFQSLVVETLGRQGAFEIFFEDEVNGQQVIRTQAITRNGGFAERKSLVRQRWRQCHFHVKDFADAIRNARDEFTHGLPGDVTRLVDFFFRFTGIAAVREQQHPCQHSNKLIPHVREYKKPLRKSTANKQHTQRPFNDLLYLYPSYERLYCLSTSSGTPCQLLGVLPT